MNFAVFLRDFDKILSEFHGYSQKITNLFQILRKKCQKNPEKRRKFQEVVQISFVQFILSMHSFEVVDWFDPAVAAELLPPDPAPAPAPVERDLPAELRAAAQLYADVGGRVTPSRAAGGRCG